MTAEDRMRVLRELGRLDDEAARLASIDADAQRYVERAASCLRQRLLDEPTEMISTDEYRAYIRSQSA